MGKIVYETVAFQAPPPISEQEFIRIRSILISGKKFKKCVSGYNYFKVNSPYLITFIICLPIGVLSELNILKIEWIGLIANLFVFFFGIKILLTLPHFIVFLIEIRKFNQHFNKSILMSGDYQDFYLKFYNDPKYYENV